MLLLLDKINEIGCQFQYHHQTRTNFVIYRTSINNGDSDNNNNSDSDNDSDSDSNDNSNNDSNYSNKGDGAKKTCIQDEPGTLVNHRITPT